MRSRRKQLSAILAIVTVGIVVFYRKGEVVQTYLPSTQKDTAERTNYDQNINHMEKEDVLPRAHPSVFSTWRTQLPPNNHRHGSSDCSNFSEPAVQGACSDRLQRLQDYCSKRRASEEEGEDGFRDLGLPTDGPSINDSVVDVFSFKQDRRIVMYCSVHKAASTFWIRLFRYLHKDTNSRPVSSPEAISKYTVHLAPFKEARPFALAYLTRRLAPGDEQFRFMFTRNPYRRLWSMYVDKFVLPDYYFWSYHGSAIKDMIGENSNNSTKRKGSHLRVDPLDACIEVNFEEFVRYTVQDESMPTAHADSHLLPIIRTCNPCTFQPNFVGRIENMTVDTQAVMERLNWKPIVRQKSFQDEILDRIHTVTQFVHDTVIGLGNLRHCVSEDELQARLIRSFIINGYFPVRVADVRRTSVGTSVTKLLNMMKELFLHSQRTADDVESQRTKFFVNAFSSLPVELLNEVKEYYREDFNAFGYDPEPPELFTERLKNNQKSPLEFS